jgi:hypothetical protein
MTRAVYWFLCLYLAVKLFEFTLGRAMALVRTEVTVRERLLSHEPQIAIAAFVFAVPAALWSSWWVHQAQVRIFENSTNCYGQLTALRSLPDVERKFDPWAVYERIELEQDAAFGTAAKLGMSSEDVRRTLSDQRSVFVRQYSFVHKQGDRQSIKRSADEIERCMKEMPSEMSHR